jgi:hypothetical protein
MSRSTTKAAAPVEAVLAGFVGYLREQRGVSVLTIDAYVADVRRFLAGRDAGSLRELTAVEVSRAVLDEAADRSPASMRRYGCALRAFFRYGHFAGLVERELSARCCRLLGGDVRCCRKGSARRKWRPYCTRSTGGGRSDDAITR